jgi:hypothetical protein
MAVNTYVCGTRPCAEVLQSVFVKLGWQAIGVVVIVFIFAPNILVLLYKAACGRSLNAHESALFKYNERYGLEGYSPYFQVSQSLFKYNERYSSYFLIKDCHPVPLQDLQSHKELEKDNTLRNRYPPSKNEVRMV